jgi:hypothetical protein
MPCCIRYNPTLGPNWQENSALVELERLLPRDGWGVVVWNDETPTAEVLATLRKIASGKRP